MNLQPPGNQTAFKKKVAVAFICTFDPMLPKKSIEVLQLCPVCGFPSFKVTEKDVWANLIDSRWRIDRAHLNWGLCSNPDCDCTYFANRRKFYTGDLIKPLFYKDQSNSAPICYCSDLTRGEIKDAVKNGCRTIDEVRGYTGKNITGNCDRMNPTGKCCNNVFLKTITGR